MNVNTEATAVKAMRCPGASHVRALCRYRLRDDKVLYWEMRCMRCEDAITSDKSPSDDGWKADIKTFFKRHRHA